ncbi:Fe-S cluster assembly ATPase SufC [Candidatus Woesearchaeota archaeon]|nr:Fe-S cluster assembly ATPase SufC [Candidatus Woesearchaeota archaeon]
MALLEINDLHVNVDGKEILKGTSLKLEIGKINTLMGPNGSGKSTLANALMGHPKYEISSGKILFNGEDITNISPDERAKKGLFLSFQYPKEIPGVTITNFLRAAIGAVKGEKVPVPEFMKMLEEKMALLKIDKKFLKRYLNEGFSGGEKKRAEILQLLMLNPKLAILDETDSGLDIDALRIVSEGVNKFMGEHKCVLIITHYKRILEYIKPDKIFIMIDGKIRLEGKGDLVDHLEEKGYGWIEKD